MEIEVKNIDNIEEEVNKTLFRAKSEFISTLIPYSPN